jgi:hypothetical protein
MDPSDFRLKNPYAIPLSALVGDAQVDRAELVVLQPCATVPDTVSAGGDGDGGGDGE